MQFKTIAKRFLKAYADEEEAKKRKEEYRQKFFEAIEESTDPSDLARQSLWYDGENPDAFVRTHYPTWRIIKKEITSVSDSPVTEWKILIEEDPAYRSHVYVDPETRKVFKRTVAESAPQPDLERLRSENYLLYERVTFQPVVPRELRPIQDISEADMDLLQNYLLPPKLTLRMEKPRDAKPEELEGLEGDG